MSLTSRRRYIYRRQDGGEVGGRGAGGARMEEQVVEHWVVCLNLNWGKEAQINVASTIDEKTKNTLNECKYQL